MLAAPLILLTLAYYFFDIDLKFHIIILQGGMPPMILASLLAISNDLDERIAIGCATLGILISFITVPIWDNIIRNLY